MPLLCHKFRPDQLKLTDFCIVSEYLPCGLVVGKSLRCMAIIVENFFRPYNGRSSVFPSNPRLAAQAVCEECASVASHRGNLYGSQSWPDHRP